MTQINRNLDLLHPLMRPLVKRFLQHPVAIAHNVQLFEGYRSPSRQQQLYKAGKVTKADAWHSMHQYGLAADLVPKPSGKWTWDESLVKKIRSAAFECDLIAPIGWDGYHFEHPKTGWLKEYIL